MEACGRAYKACQGCTSVISAQYCNHRSLGELLARHASAGEASRVPVYAVDVSVWSRCDAEASPGRGYYHPSRHSASQPTVAG
jgi:hypothetical protein